jgi:hypothetical protein
VAWCGLLAKVYAAGADMIPLLLLLLLLLLLQELGGSVPARLVFRAQGLAEGWKDPNIRRAVVRGMWLLSCCAHVPAQRDRAVHLQFDL